LDRVRAQTQGFVEQQQEVKRVISAMEKFKPRIERRQDEMAEKQRLTDEQVQRRWEEWISAQANEQKKRQVIIEERWRQQDQTNQGDKARLAELLATDKVYHAQLTALWESLQANAASLLKAVHDVYEVHAEPIEDQLTILRDEQRK